MTVKETCGDGKGRNHHQSQRTLANKPAAESDIDPGEALEHAIEQVKELVERPAALLLWPEQQPGKGRAQRESVKGREDYRDGDGDGELLVQPSGNTRDEGRGYKDRRENHGNTDDGTGELFHGFSSGIFRRQTLLDMALYTFDDHNGIIHHQADGQHHPDRGERIDRETQKREEEKRA